MKQRTTSTKDRKRKNNICVIGLGRYGTAVVDELVEHGISVLAIDEDEKPLEKYLNHPQVTQVSADATNIEALQALGLDEIKTVIVAAPNNIEIVASLLEMNIEHIIARASSARSARVLKQIGVDLIVRPEIESGTRTALIAANSNFIKFSRSLTELGNGFVIGSSQVLNNSLINIELKNLKFNNYGITLVLVKRDSDSFLPFADLKFKIGDELMIVGKIEKVMAFFELLNKNSYDISTRAKWRKY